MALEVNIKELQKAIRAVKKAAGSQAQNAPGHNKHVSIEATRNRDIVVKAIRDHSDINGCYEYGPDSPLRTLSQVRIKTANDKFLSEHGGAFVAFADIEKLLKNLSKIYDHVTFHCACDGNIELSGCTVLGHSVKCCEFYGADTRKVVANKTEERIAAVVVEASELLNLLQKVSPARAQDDPRRSLCGVCFDGRYGAIAATDGHRLHYVYRKWIERLPKDVILDGNSVNGLIEALKWEAADTNIIITVTESQIEFQGVNILYVAPRTDADFPDWPQVRPNFTKPVEVEMPGADFQQTVTKLYRSKMGQTCYLKSRREWRVEVNGSFAIGAERNPDGTLTDPDSELTHIPGEVVRSVSEFDNVVQFFIDGLYLTDFAKAIDKEERVGFIADLEKRKIGEGYYNKPLQFFAGDLHTLIMPRAGHGVR